MKTLTRLAADIVVAQASHVTMSAEEIEETLNKVFEALKQINDIEIYGVEILR